jgi:trk system potassium uptake protein TrkA
MNVIVVGCGRLGSDLAYRLSQRPDTQVVVVDMDKDAFNKLPNDYGGRIVEGDALAQDVLVRAGIDKADALAAATDSDALNLVVGHVARTFYDVPVVVARNFDPRTRGLFEVFGLQVVSATSWGAQRLEEMLHHADLRAVFSAGNGEVEVYEFTVPTFWDGHTLGELINGYEVVPTSMSRAGRAFLPTAESVLQAGDIVHVSATMVGIESMRQVLRAKEA